MSAWKSTTTQSVMNTNRTGAYTAVNARKTLSGGKSETSTPPSHQASAGKKKTEFPQDLKNYVARAFENLPDAEKNEVEKELKDIITDAFDKDIVWKINWDNLDLPQQRIKRRKMYGQADGDIVMKDVESEVKRVEGTLRRVKTNNFDGAATTMTTSPSSSTTVTPTRSPPQQDGGFTAPGSKKRKSLSSTDNHTSESPTQSDRHSSKQWEKDLYAYGEDRSTELENMRDKRAKRFAKELTFNTNAPPWKKEKESQYSTPKADMETEGPVVGRCMDLEKRYLRLTSAPDPNMVRPLHVLEKTLDLLKKKWRTENNYSYICDQFKSLRQDLTVQHIKSEFTITVYEIHGRIALEKGDLGEYNQCQSQLQKLYQEIPRAGHPTEFKAYRILYLLHTCNQTDMSDVLASLTKTEKSDKAIQHALAVRSVLAANNYHRFFRLYLDCPNMGAYLMDSFIERERLAALEIICKAYRVFVELRFLTEELGFESDSECVQFLSDHGAGDFLAEKKDENGSAVKFNCPPARPLFTTAKEAAFRKVDIKGQI
ncbi:SAC3/GANP/Nin1/mts3/eIF-3 p25 family-domain-containing protein [Tirmania nivea]|nr:SAC3/GANP/Nin1/mts3/eIF-3 p25 family-domain-containing protein [Tirmania nivea]